MSTTMLYRPGETINPEAWNLPIEILIVEDEAVEGALAEGWFTHPSEFPKSAEPKAAAKRGESK